MTAYATASDYAAYLGQPYPGDWDDAEVLRINAGLLNAQDDVTAAVYLSTYSATDTEKSTALTRATCARFQFLETTGDDGSGALLAFDSVRVGPVSLSRSTDKDTVQTDKLVAALGTRAAQILYGAGFFTGAVAHS